MKRSRVLAFRPSRRFTILYLAAAGLFAWITFSDDSHAILNDGNAITALSVGTGVLVAAVAISAARARR